MCCFLKTGWKRDQCHYLEGRINSDETEYKIISRTEIFGKKIKLSNRSIFRKISIKISNRVAGINTALHEYEGLLRAEDKADLAHFAESIYQIITLEIWIQCKIWSLYLVYWSNVQIKGRKLITYKWKVFKVEEEGLLAAGILCKSINILDYMLRNYSQFHH